MKSNTKLKKYSLFKAINILSLCLLTMSCSELEQELEQESNESPINIVDLKSIPYCSDTIVSHDPGEIVSWDNGTRNYEEDVYECRTMDYQKCNSTPFCEPAIYDRYSKEGNCIEKAFVRCDPPYTLKGCNMEVSGLAVDTQGECWMLPEMCGENSFPPMKFTREYLNMEENDWIARCVE